MHDRRICHFRRLLPIINLWNERKDAPCSGGNGASSGYLHHTGSHPHLQPPSTLQSLNQHQEQTFQASIVRVLPHIFHPTSSTSCNVWTKL